MIKWLKIGVLLSSLIGITPAGYGQTRSASGPKDGTASVEGTVLDAETKQPIIGATVSARSQFGTMRGQQAVTTDGAYKLILDPKQPYIITTQASGYELLEEQVAFTSSLANRLRRQPTLLFRTGRKSVSATEAALPQKAPVHTLATSIIIQPPADTTSNRAADGSRLTPPKTLDAKVVYTPPLVVAAAGKITQLRAIQFVQSKAELLPDAQPALDQLLAFMRDKPTTEILLAGHTDNQGDFDQNVLLSKQRVDLVKEFLVKNGIAASRISTRGYGPTRPVASNNAELSRQQNRRVEMIIVKQ